MVAEYDDIVEGPQLRSTVAGPEPGNDPVNVMAFHFLSMNAQLGI